MADGTRACSIEGCDRAAGVPGSARGWCGLHYGRWQRNGDPLRVRRQRKVCAIDGCGKLVKSDGWCSQHHSRFLRHGSPTARLRGEVVDGKRICPRCNVDKPLDEYSPHRSQKSGLAAYCKPCQAARAAENRARPGWVRSPRDHEQGQEYIRRWRAENPDAVRSQCALRRARRNQATTEKFSVEEIFDRDGWICHLCGEGIDRTITYPDPMSRSLDHIVPLARGGAHSRDNCAASHLLCNMRKKDKLVEASKCGPLGSDS